MLFLKISRKQEFFQDSIPWDWNQTNIKLGKKHVICQKLSILCRKRISLWTGLNVSSLARKYVFYIIQRKGPMEVNFEGLKMQKWYISMDKVQRIDEKNWVICLVIMFNPGVTVIKISKMTHCLYFLLMAAKYQS